MYYEVLRPVTLTALPGSRVLLTEQQAACAREYLTPAAESGGKAPDKKSAVKKQNETKQSGLDV